MRVFKDKVHEDVIRNLVNVLLESRKPLVEARAVIEFLLTACHTNWKWSKLPGRAATNSSKSSKVECKFPVKHTST